MRSSIVLQSLFPGNPIYTWSAKNGWVMQDPTFTLPKQMWISNQTGIRVGSYGSVDVDSFISLLAGLPSIHQDLVLDAAEKIGFKDTRAISKTRWEKLSKPRPLEGEKELRDDTLYAKYGDQVFMLDIDVKGRGGWYAVSGLPEGVEFSKCPMWKYEVYCPVLKTITLPSCCARRIITATLDNLYCYSDDDAIRSYLVWAQDKIKALWEASLSNESKGAC